MFKINPSSAVPIYRQFVDQIRRKVSSGQLKPGDTLPSVRQLASNHAVNAMTVSKAYSLLEAEGLLHRQRGKAMAVAADNLAETKAQRLQRLAPAIDQLVSAAQQLDIHIDDLTTAVRNRLEQPNA